MPDEQNQDQKPPQTEAERVKQDDPPMLDVVHEEGGPRTQAAAESDTAATEGDKYAALASAGNPDAANRAEHAERLQAENAERTADAVETNRVQREVLAEAMGSRVPEERAALEQQMAGEAQALSGMPTWTTQTPPSDLAQNEIRADAAFAAAGDSVGAPLSSRELADRELELAKAFEHQQAVAGVPAHLRTFWQAVNKARAAGRTLEELSVSERKDMGITLIPGSFPGGESTMSDYLRNELEAGPLITTTRNRGEIPPLRDPIAIASKDAHPTPMVESRLPVQVAMNQPPEGADPNEYMAHLEVELQTLRVILAAIIRGGRLGADVIGIPISDIRAAERGDQVFYPMTLEGVTDRVYIELRKAERDGVPAVANMASGQTAPMQELRTGHIRTSLPQALLERAKP